LWVLAGDGIGIEKEGAYEHGDRTMTYEEKQAEAKKLVEGVRDGIIEHEGVCEHKKRG